MEPTTDQTTRIGTGAGSTGPTGPTELTAPTGSIDLIKPIDPTGATDPTGTAGHAGAAFGAPGTSPSPTQVPGTEGRRKFRLRRSRTDRMLGGVCGGLGESLGVDPALVRIGLVTLTVLGAGSGVILYAAVWLLAPETDEP